MAASLKRMVSNKIGYTINKTTSRIIIYSQSRFKTYLVGVDGSNYGYYALQSASTMSTTQDKLISIYFPPNIAVKYTIIVNCLYD